MTEDQQWHLDEAAKLDPITDTTRLEMHQSFAHTPEKASDMRRCIEGYREWVETLHG